MSKTSDKDDLLAMLLAEEGIEEDEGQEQKTKIVRVERPSRPPLSFSQELLWLLHRLMPNTTAYNVRWAMKIQGELDVDALQRSLDTMLARHDVLRTTFADVDGEPYQVIREPCPLAVEHKDARSWTTEAQDAEVQRLLRRNMDRPWSFKDDIIHGTLLRLRDDEYLLLLELHHVYCDGWSRGIFFRELSAVYDAYVNGKPNPLPPMAIQYVDFAIWQRAWRDSADYEKQINYWKGRLTGAPALLELPTDRPRPPTQTYKGGRQNLRIPADLTDKLKKLSLKGDATLFMTLLAAFKTLLYRYTGQDDIVVGSPIANRNRSEVEPLIGFFVNAVILRDQLTGDTRFVDLVKQVRDGALEAYEHQDIPYEKLVIELKPDRDLSYTPLFQVMFILQNVPKESRALTGLTISSVELGQESAKFDLTLSCTEVGDEINAIVAYNVDLFDASTMQSFLAHFRVLLEAVVADPTLTLDRIPILPPEERDRLLFNQNRNERDFAERRPVHELIAARAKERPDATAVVFEGDRITYAELDRRANKLANHLVKLGVTPESLVGISGEKSVMLVVGFLAILKSGGAYVPIDPSYPKDRLHHILDECRPPVLLLTESALADGLPEHDARVVCLDKDWSEIEGEPETAPPSSPSLDRLAYAIFTSGSTGKSKGVLIEHGNLLNQYLAWEETFRLGELTSHLQMASMSFDVFTGDFVRALCSGGKLVLCQRERLLDPSKIVELIDREKVDCAEFVPAVLRTVMQHMEEKGRKLDSIKFLVAGSDVWHVKEYKKFRSFLPDGARLASTYGLTETTIDSTFYEKEDALLPAPDRAVPIGKPFANTRIYLVNKALQPVPVGVRGEIYIGGRGVTRGYLNRPDLTADRFIPDVLAGDGRLYRTGDVARWLKDGEIEFLGRSDHQVKVRGYRVELGEIESVIAEHPAVRKAVVIVREDEPGQKRLVGYVVGHEGLVDTADLKAFLKGKLPDYMVPPNLLALESLPLSHNGKIDIKQLPRPDADQEQGKGYVAPRDVMEMQLAGIWERILNLKPVGVTDNFFEIGGHSLLAVKLISEIDKLGKTLPLASLFQLQTIEEQARFLGQPEGEQPWPTVLAVNPKGKKLPLFCVARPNSNALGYIALSRNLGADQPLYGLQSRYREENNGPYELWEYQTIAADYIREMKKVQPQGPYQLTGMCEGAHIAFEMVRMLIDAGDQVQMFCALDAWPVENTRIRFLAQIDAMLRPFKQLWTPLAEMSREDRIEHIKKHSLIIGEKILRKSKKLAFGSKSAASGAGGNGNGDGEAPPQDLKAIFDRRYFPGPDWVPTVIPCRIYLLRVPEQKFYRIRDPECGWGSRTSRGVTVYHVDSHHTKLLREPNVRHVADRLNQAMAAAASEVLPPRPAAPQRAEQPSGAV